MQLRLGRIRRRRRLFRRSFNRWTSASFRSIAVIIVANFVASSGSSSSAASRSAGMAGVPIFTSALRA
jgi:hypothetical protein